MYNVNFVVWGFYDCSEHVLTILEPLRNDNVAMDQGGISFRTNQRICLRF